MVSVCFYLFVHQPYRLRRFRVFDVGKEVDYFDEDLNQHCFSQVARNSYLPTNSLLLNLIEKHDGKFKFAISLSGVAIEQMARYAPEVLQSFRDLAKTGCVEFLSGTYYQSLSMIYSEDEFTRQVEMHKDLIKKHFNQEPRVFRNTGLIYDNSLGETLSDLGFRGVLVDASSHVEHSDLNYLYKSPSDNSNLVIFPKNVSLSEDISKRFSDKSWSEWPLTADKYKNWINKVNGGGEIVNLFMPYEIFGEHHGQETGILDFVERFPTAILDHPDNRFVTPSEGIIRVRSNRVLNVPKRVVERKMQGDLNDIWLGNDMQRDAIEKLYAIEEEIKQHRDPELLEDWRKLTTVDNFFYMNTTAFKNPEMRHKNIYGSPYDSYLYYINILSDIKYRLNMQKVQQTKDEILRMGSSKVDPISSLKSSIRSS